MFVSTQDGRTALHMAAQEGKVDVVRLLLTEAQTLVNIQNKVYKQYLAIYNKLYSQLTITICFHCITVG